VPGRTGLRGGMRTAVVPGRTGLRGGLMTSGTRTVPTGRADLVVLPRGPTVRGAAAEPASPVATRWLPMAHAGSTRAPKSSA
jgi:hypothetical protein